MKTRRKCYEEPYPPEMIEKAKTAESIEELLELAKANGVEITEDDRQRKTLLSARDVVMTMGLPETKAYLNVPNADVAGMSIPEKSSTD